MQSDDHSLACDLCGPAPYVPPHMYESSSREQLSSYVEYSSVQRQYFLSTIDVMQKQISRIDDEMRHLKHHRQNILQAIDELSSMLAPVRRVPGDILSEIFLLCRARAFDQTEAPLLLTQVCSRWRAVAISTQALWSSMIFGSYFQTSPELLHLWLMRSGGYPLNLDLRSEPPESAYSRREAVFDALIQHHSRWQDINLFMLPSDLGLLEVVPGSFPLLRTIVLRFHRSGRLNSSPFHFFEVAPKLTAVTLIRGAKPSMFTLPWSQLTAYTLADTSVTTCLLSLWQCPNIVTCRIHCTNKNGSILKSSVKNQEYSSLRSFTIQTKNQKNFLPILDHVTAPSLTFLKVENFCDVHRTPVPPVPLIPFLERSHCNLQQLVFKHLAISAKELIAILQHTPDLNELNIIEWCMPHTLAIFSSEVFQRLTNDENVSSEMGLQPLVPRLQILTLQGRMEEVDDAVVIDMLESRRRRNEDNRVAQIRRVRLSIEKYEGGKFPPRSDARKSVRLWRRDGMDVFIGGTLG